VQAHLGQFIGGLHPDQGVGADPEGLIKPNCHFSRQAGSPVQQCAHRLPCHTKPRGGIGDRQAMRIDNLGSQPFADRDVNAGVKLQRHQ
jgi:hypothetical protein